jgi:hypothetical protein
VVHGGFRAHLQANPNKLNMGSGGTGGPIRMIAELFMMMTADEQRRKRQENDHQRKSECGPMKKAALTK